MAAFFFMSLVSCLYLLITTGVAAPLTPAQSSLSITDATTSDVSTAPVPTVTYFDTAETTMVQAPNGTDEGHPLLRKRSGCTSGPVNLPINYAEFSSYSNFVDLTITPSIYAFKAGVSYIVYGAAFTDGIDCTQIYDWSISLPYGTQYGPTGSDASEIRWAFTPVNSNQLTMNIGLISDTPGCNVFIQLCEGTL